MKRRTLNLLALAVLALGGAWLAAPADAAASALFARCTQVTTAPDGTVTTIVVEGKTCSSDVNGHCSCTS
jgi:hypothetical protein